jgi:hypothetical protein
MLIVFHRQGAMSHIVIFRYAHTPRLSVRPPRRARHDQHD